MTTRGIRRLPILLCEADYELFLSILARVAERYRWKLHAYCLMPNHYHLVVETPEPTLSLGMHALNSRYAHAFNERYGYSGHVFEARFDATLVERQGHLLEVVRYVVLNPVRARLCVEPGEWRWSSYRAVAGLTASPAWLAADAVVGLFGAANAAGRRRFRAFVRDGVVGRAAVRRPAARPP